MPQRRDALAGRRTAAPRDANEISWSGTQHLRIPWSIERDRASFLVHFLVWTARIPIDEVGPLGDPDLLGDILAQHQIGDSECDLKIYIPNGLIQPPTV